jgi:hypothetical protein
LLRAIGRESVPLADAASDDAATKVGDPFAGGVRNDICSRACPGREFEVAAPRNFLRLCSRGNREQQDECERQFRNFQRFVGTGGTTAGAGAGAGAAAGADCVDTPFENPLAFFRILMFFMLGSDRKPMPATRRFGSVITNALSLEISFFC